VKAEGESFQLNFLAEQCTIRFWNVLLRKHLNSDIWGSSDFHCIVFQQPSST